MITLTLEMDFPEDRNAEILEKLSKLFDKNNNVKIKELRIGEKDYYPLHPATFPSYPNTTPNTTPNIFYDYSNLINSTTSPLSVTLGVTSDSVSECVIDNLVSSLED